MGLIEPDELYTLRSLFWIGSYQAAINEANSLNKLKGALLEEKEEYIYRSYIGLNQYQMVIGEINENSPSTSIGKKAIKALANYLSVPSAKENSVRQVKDWLNEINHSKNITLKVIAATIFILEDNMQDAFRVLAASAAISLELSAMLIQLYLRINRADLAEAQLKQMKTLDEENSLTMLVTAWIYVAAGGNKAQDASYIYEELIDKHGSSPSLLNGLAVSKMHLLLFEEAEVALKEALSKSNGSDPDSLANLIIVSSHLQRPQDVVQRYINQLKNKSPNHDLVSTLTTFENSFDRVASML